MKKKATKKPKESSSQRETAQKKRQAVFLKAFMEIATITHAARAAKIGRQTHYDWLKKDGEYQEAFADAKAAAGDALIAEARRRALEYSDTLLIFLLKGAYPEKYRENYHHTGDMNVALVDLLNAGRDRLAKHRESRD